MIHERLAVHFKEPFTAQPDGDLPGGSAAAVSFFMQLAQQPLYDRIYIPGFIMGLGGSFMTAYKLYLAIMKTQKKKKNREHERSFNNHV